MQPKYYLILFNKFTDAVAFTPVTHWIGVHGLKR